MSFTIIGIKYSPEEFENYLKTVVKQAWVKNIVLHNTAAPSLAQRPGGVLTQQHIKNLKSYYEGLGWSGGPHLFVDATGIWVFNPLNKKGVHSPSYNSSAWGVEMLGNYQTESFTSGLGLEVAKNAQSAIASLAKLQGWPDVTGEMILHKEDVNTTHKTCPGKNVDKQKFIDEVNKLMKTTDKPIKVLANGKIIEGAYMNDKSVTFVPLRALSEALGCTVKYDAANNQVVVTK